MSDVHEIEIAASRIPVLREPPRTLLDMLSELQRCEQLEFLQDVMEAAK